MACGLCIYKLTKMLNGVFVLMTAAYILPGTQVQLLRKLRAFLLQPSVAGLQVCSHKL